MVLGPVTELFVIIAVAVDPSHGLSVSTVCPSLTHLNTVVVADALVDPMTTKTHTKAVAPPGIGRSAATSHRARYCILVFIPIPADTPDSQSAAQFAANLVTPADVSHRYWN